MAVLRTYGMSRSRAEMSQRLVHWAAAAGSRSARRRESSSAQASQYGQRSNECEGWASRKLTGPLVDWKGLTDGTVPDGEVKREEVGEREHHGGDDAERAMLVEV